MGDLHEIQRAYAGLDALRPGQAVGDRRAHVGVAELGEDRTIHVFDHRMHDALWMHDDVDRIRWRVEQEVRLDQLEPLIHQRRRIDADLRPHGPHRVM